MRLEDKIAVVTGSGQGIGKAIAKCLAEEGAKVVVADIDEKTAKSVATGILADGRQAMVMQVDVTKSKEVATVFKRVLAEYGRIDILVNNAGYNKLQPFVENTEEFWDMMIAVNLKGTIMCSRAVLDSMIERKYGKIVNISSDSGLSGSSGCVVYSAAKGGVISFTKALAKEVAQYNINVNCVAPGPTQTPLWDRFIGQKPEILDNVIQATPQKRVGKPEEIASAVLFLASDEAVWMTGQTLSVSGGFIMI
jgi:2-hydroxycyclohexanecarboxyl-CoA dehydrogenase